MSEKEDQPLDKPSVAESSEAEQMREFAGDRGDQKAEAFIPPEPERPRQQVAVRDDQPVATTTAASVMSIIQQVAQNPHVDVAKMEALLNMQERILDRQAKADFDAAFARMQPHLPVVDRKGRIEIKEKVSGNVIQTTPFARFEDINEAIRPVLAEHGFGVRFETGMTDDGRVKVTGVLSGHGHRETAVFVLQHDSTGSKNSVQAVGSSTSYGKRYALCALLNITTRGEDDDGATGGKPLMVGDPMTEEQVETVIDLAGAEECPQDRLVAHMNKNRPRGHPEARSIRDIPSSRYKEVTDAIRSYGIKKRERDAERRAATSQGGGAQGAA